MDIFANFERVARAVLQRHYLIPEVAYWLALVVLGMLTVIGTTRTADLVGGGLIFVAAVGIGRWRTDRRRCRGALVVPRFREGGGTEGHAEEAQRILVDQLRKSLKPQESSFIQSLSVTVGGDETALARRLQRRLRASFVLHGRLASRAEGGWSVLPRILEPDLTAMHYDPFTRDITPARASFGPLVSRLPAEHGVRDEEFPFEFAKDLEALTRSIAGLVASAMHDYGRAITLLQEALAVSGESTSWLMDALRVSLARAHADSGNVECGLDVLRPRLEGEDPSPHLLRGYAWLLSRQGKSMDTRAEAKAVLRRAMEVKGDPQRDQTVHNLMSLLSSPANSDRNKEESEELLRELLNSPSNYRKTWYIKRALGLNAWLRGLDAWENTDPVRAKAEAKEAAKWYAGALRARPRLQIKHMLWRPPFVIYNRFPPSPIMRANLKDAHQMAHRPLRTVWHERRFQRVRGKMMKVAFEAFEVENYQRAYAHFDWAIVGRHDEYEALARVHSAVSLWLLGRKAEAEETWGQARASNPFAFLVRAWMAKHLRENGHDDPVPGKEPTEIEAVEKMVAELVAENPQGHTRS